MTKTDLIAQVAANTEMSKKSAELAVNAAFEALGKAISGIMQSFRVFSRKIGNEGHMSPQKEIDNEKNSHSGACPFPGAWTSVRLRQH